MRVVLDTNVMVAALRSPRGASARLVDAVRGGACVAVANVALFVEWEAVLTRSEHLVAAGASVAEVTAALDELAGLVDPAERAFSWRPQLADPDDEMVLEAAVNGQANAIVTFEVSTFAEAARRFAIEVLTPTQAWSRIRL